MWYKRKYFEDLNEFDKHQISSVIKKKKLLKWNKTKD